MIPLSPVLRIATANAFLGLGGGWSMRIFVRSAAGAYFVSGPAGR